MMSNFEMEFRGFLDDMLENVVSDLRKKNIHYDICKDFIKENIDKYRNIINTLPESDRQFIETYREQEFHKTAIEQGEFYYRGYTDCVKLLKSIGVL